MERKNNTIIAPYNVGTGSIVEVGSYKQEFPTEDEAWEFYNERRNSNG